MTFQEFWVPSHQWIDPPHQPVMVMMELLECYGMKEKRTLSVFWKKKKPPSSLASFYCRTRYQFIYLFLSQRVTRSKKKKVGGSRGVVKTFLFWKGERKKKGNKCVHSTLTRLKRRKLKGDTVYIEKASSSSSSFHLFFFIISFRFCGS